MLCSQHELRPVYHLSGSPCPRAHVWADTLRRGGLYPEPSGPQQVTKKEKEKLEPQMRMCKKYLQWGCGESKFFSGRACPPCLEKRDQFRQEKALQKQERLSAQAARPKASRRSGKGAASSSSSGSSSSSSAADAAAASSSSAAAAGKKRKRASSSEPGVPPPKAAAAAVSNVRRPLRTAALAARQRADFQREVNSPDEDSSRSSSSEASSGSSSSEESTGSSSCDEGGESESD